MRTAGTPGTHSASARTGVAAWGTVAVGLVSALVAWAVAGVAGLAAGLVGTLLVLGFFASGAVPLFLAGQAGLRARAGVALLLLTYTLRLVLVLLVLAAALQTDLVDGPALGLTVIVCALAWSAVQMAAVLRASAGK